MFVDVPQARAELGNYGNHILSSLLDTTDFSLDKSPVPGFIKHDPLTIKELRVLRDAALTQGARALRLSQQPGADEVESKRVAFYGALALMIFDRLESTGRSLAREPQNTTLAEVTASFDRRE